MTLKASVLPNGRTQFFNNAGAPLAGGSVGYYIPATMDFKDTWQDPEENTLNLNPVDLDGSGTALVWGSGEYRMIVKDSTGATIYDVLTYVNAGADGGAGFGARIAIASANAVDLGVATSHNVLLTGAVTIASFGNSATLASPIWICTVATGLTITNSIDLIVPGSADYLFSEGDSFICEFRGAAQWQILDIWPAVGNSALNATKWVNNLWDFIPANIRTGVLQTIKNGVWSGIGPRTMDVYFDAAIAAGTTCSIPAGFYSLSDTLVMVPGMEFWGAGSGWTVSGPTTPGTVITLGGAVGAWSVEMLNANGTNTVPGFVFKDIFFLCTQNGIRWNSITGGFTDDNTSQAYMISPRLERCVFLNDSAIHYIGVQLNKCFDFSIVDCRFTNFLNSLDFEGSDIGRVELCRFDTDTGYTILANSHGTFGSSLVIKDCDFNNPALGYLSTSYLDLLAHFNHMELDSGAMRDQTIYVHGDAFHTKIHDNRIQNGGFATNWLKVDPDANRFLVSVINNTTSAAGEMGTVSYPSQVYFSNGGFRSLVRHGGNSAGDGPSFPMNSRAVGEFIIPPGYAAQVTCNTPGVSSAGNLNPLCQSGVFTIHPNVDATQYMKISDWEAYGLVANQLIGTLTIEIISAGGANGQVGSWEVLDNGVHVSSGTIVHAVANQYYKTVIIASHTFGTNAEVRLWNVDVGTGERFYVQSVSFKIG